MFIPGYGKRGSAVTGGFSLMYTIPLNKNKTAEVNKIKEGDSGY